jgi:pycsar effector protein
MTKSSKQLNRSRSHPESAAIDTAWRIHGAIADWTGKVDAKASFCVAIESAALVAVVNLTSDRRLFDELPTDAERFAFYSGLSLVTAGLLSAVYVVTPRLRRFKTRKEWADNFIYFGHLRKWRPEDLESRISSAPILTILSTQLINMSKIAWRKHVMVQASLVLGFAGAVCLGVCAILVQ